MSQAAIGTEQGRKKEREDAHRYCIFEGEDRLCHHPDSGVDNITDPQERAANFCAEGPGCPCEVGYEELTDPCQLCRNYYDGTHQGCYACIGNSNYDSIEE